MMESAMVWPHFIGAHRFSPPPVTRRTAGLLAGLGVMVPTKILALLLSALVMAMTSHAFMPSCGQPRRLQGRIVMRDASAVVDFAKGDVVKVKPGVKLDGRDYGAMVGTVTDTWEKCEVDPHCCCAELATEGSVKVEFDEDEEAGKRLYNMFAENELEMVKKAQKESVA